MDVGKGGPPSAGHWGRMVNLNPGTEPMKKGEKQKVVGCFSCWGGVRKKVRERNSLRTLRLKESWGGGAARGFRERKEKKKNKQKETAVFLLSTQSIPHRYAGFRSANRDEKMGKCGAGKGR